MRSWAGRRAPRSRAGTTRSRSRASSCSRIRTRARGSTGRSTIRRTTACPACPMPATAFAIAHYVKRGLELLWSLAVSLPLSDDERRAARLSAMMTAIARCASARAPVRGAGGSRARRRPRRRAGRARRGDRARRQRRGRRRRPFPRRARPAAAPAAIVHRLGARSSRPRRRRGRSRVPHRPAHRDRRGRDPRHRRATRSSRGASPPSTIASSSTGSAVTARRTTPSSRPC